MVPSSVDIGGGDIVERLVIPLVVVVFHKGLNLSLEIKNVLPALVPDMSYDSLRITDCEMASIQYEAMVTEDIDQQGRNRTREPLLEYCKQDTMAMVKLFEILRTRT